RREGLFGRLLDHVVGWSLVHARRRRAVSGTRGPGHAFEHPPRRSRVNPGVPFRSGCEPAPLAPPPQRDPHGDAVQPQRGTEVGERVGPFEIVGLEPGAGLGEAGHPAEVRVHGVLEDREHEAPLGLEHGRTLRPEVLARQEGLELVECQLLVLWRSLSRHVALRCNSPASDDGTENRQSSDGVRSPGARPTCRPACRSSTLLAAFCMPEEDPMTRDELVELSDLNYAEAMRDLSRRAGGTVLDEDGLLLFPGGHPLPVLANATMRTERRLGAGEVLERARAFFGARGRGFTVLVRAHADADLAGAAADAGLLAMG